MVFGKQLVITNSSGEGYATIMLNADNQPERFRLPLQVMIEAIATENDGIRCNMIVYITGTGSISGYVVDDDTSTITGADHRDDARRPALQRRTLHFERRLRQPDGILQD